MSKSISITGGCGFIGSNLVRYLNALGIIPNVFDELTNDNWPNLAGCNFNLYEREAIFDVAGSKSIIVHLGADSSTSTPMSKDLWGGNVLYTQKLLTIPFDKMIFASSGSVYGTNTDDFTERTEGLVPKSPYAMTKLHADKLIERLNYEKVYSLRFFNVYGKYEESKGSMASVISQAIKQKQAGYTTLSLFNSFRGIPMRDFVYVKDICSVIKHFIDKNGIPQGIYNVGTGSARAFETIAGILKLNVLYKGIPEHLMNHYQMYTEADITKLRDVAGYNLPFHSLEQGIKDMTEQKE